MKRESYEGALADIVEMGLAEFFIDEYGHERVRLTPRGMRHAGVPEDEIAGMVRAEEAAGRPYSPGQVTP